MAYFKINDEDFSYCVNELKVGTTANYNAQTNAAGDTVVDFINRKKVIEVGIIPLNELDLGALTRAINNFTMSITYLEPELNTLKTIDCILPESNVEYQMIRVGNTMSKAFTLQFIEL